ncbi:cyclic nucleotide-binding domain-containing protein [bacterium]|nr:MAG: cyclic nucleotide-binding domain-containing protein [bacterium]
MEIDLNVFKKNYLVAGLGDEDVRRVSRLAEVEVAQPGEEIVKLGSREPDLFVILDGTAIVYREGGVVLAERGPGAVIGEIALVDDGPRSAYVHAKTTLAYAKFDGRALRRFMFEHKDVGFIMLSNVSRVLSATVRQASATIEGLSVKLIDPWEHALQ